MSFFFFPITSLLFYISLCAHTINIKKKKSRFECKKCLARTMTRYSWIVTADHSDCRICYNLRYMDAKRYQKAFQDKQLVCMAIKLLSIVIEAELMSRQVFRACPKFKQNSDVNLRRKVMQKRILTLTGKIVAGYFRKIKRANKRAVFKFETKRRECFPIALLFFSLP